jgi:hypothetical protein
MAILLSVILVLILLAISYYSSWCRVDGLARYTAPALLLVKLGFALALWAVYTFYYTDRGTSDIYKYYDDATVIHQAQIDHSPAWLALMIGSSDTTYTAAYTSQMNSWTRRYNGNVPVNENRTMIRLHAAMMALWGENIHANNFVFCFLSFIGCMMILQVLVYYLPNGYSYLGLVCVAFPSFLFWTSGALKESLMLLGVGALLYGVAMQRATLLSRLFAITIGIGTLILLRYFLLICLMPGLLAYWALPRVSSLHKLLAKYATTLLLCGMIAVYIAPLDTRVNFPRIVYVKQKNAIGEAQYMNAGSYSPVSRVDMSLSSVLRYMPEGLRNTLCKPYPWMSHNPMMLMSALENILWIILLLLAITHSRRDTYVYWNLFLFMAVSLAIYYSLIGLVAPVIGNLVRYRVILLPCWVYLLLSMIDTRVWDKLLPKWSHPKA